MVQIAPVHKGVSQLGVDQKHKVWKFGNVFWKYGLKQCLQKPLNICKMLNMFVVLNLFYKGRHQSEKMFSFRYWLIFFSLFLGGGVYRWPHFCLFFKTVSRIIHTLWLYVFWIRDFTQEKSHFHPTTKITIPPYCLLLLCHKMVG